MRNLLLIATTIAVAFSCIPDGAKRHLDEQTKNAHTMLADLQFKKSVANIELHKTRYGNYPASLRDLKFLSMMDSGFVDGVEYIKLDSGYELNLKYDAVLIGGGKADITLIYPDEFWQGLGCVKSNLKSK